MGNKQ
jgi:hypothetical protein